MKSGALVPAALVMMMVVMAAFFTTNASAVPGLGLDPQVSSAEGEGDDESPCCDNCGICTRSYPPFCKCDDNLLLVCPPWCKTCVESPLRIYPQRYICEDLILNYCEKQCTPPTLRSTVE